MRNHIIWQKLEGAFVLILGLGLYIGTGQTFAFWAAFLWFFAPDLSFAAYLLGNRTGAIVYNITHLYAFGPLITVMGLTMGNAPISSLGFLWLAHAGFDRALGYGLKSHTSFKDTHLGKIGSE